MAGLQREHLREIRLHEGRRVIDDIMTLNLLSLSWVLASSSSESFPEKPGIIPITFWSGPMLESISICFRISISVNLPDIIFLTVSSSRAFLKESCRIFNTGSGMALGPKIWW